MDALNHLAENPEATNDDLFQFVKGPDFPTGGIIYNEKDIKHAYASGRGGVILRGEAILLKIKPVISKSSLRQSLIRLINLI